MRPTAKLEQVPPFFNVDSRFPHRFGDIIPSEVSRASYARKKIVHGQKVGYSFGKVRLSRPEQPDNRNLVLSLCDNDPIVESA